MKSILKPLDIDKLKYSLKSLLLTESQNGRGWKGPLEIILSNPLLEQPLLEQGAQDCVQTGFECPQGRRLHSLPGQPVPLLWHPHRNGVFSHVFSWNFLCFNLRPLPLVLPLGTIEKSPFPTS